MKDSRAGVEHRRRDASSFVQRITMRSNGWLAGKAFAATVTCRLLVMSLALAG
jgi:hypothetical protein